MLYSRQYRASVVQCSQIFRVEIISWVENLERRKMALAPAAIDGQINSSYGPLCAPYCLYALGADDDDASKRTTYNEFRKSLAKWLL